MSATFCAACKGACCKTNPGATLPSDWGASVDEMRVRLDAAFQTGNWCVALPRTRIPLLYVMPKATPTGCTFLTPTGCTFKTEPERPAACRDLKAAPTFPQGCSYPSHVTMQGTRHSEIYYAMQWRQYRPLLDELAKKYQAA